MLKTCLVCFFPRINKQGKYVSVRNIRTEHSALGSDLGYIRGLSQSGQDRQTASPHGQMGTRMGIARTQDR